MKYNVIGLLALLIWACSLPFGKRCSEDLGPLTTAALPGLVGGCIGLCSNLFLGKLRRSELVFFRNREFYLRAGMFALYGALLYFAIGVVDRQQLPVVTLLNYLWPTLTMIFSVIAFKQHFKAPLLIIGSTIVIIGLGVEIIGEKLFVLISQPQSGKTLLAFLSAAGAAVTWAVYTVMNRSWGLRAGGIVALPFVMLVSSAVLFSLRFAFNETSNFTPEVLPPLIYLCVLPYFSGICWDVGTRKGSITMLSLVADVLPWASLTVADLYLGITIGSRTWVSAVFIICGALISRLSLIIAAKQEQPA
jgi:drug/metabolite transporter (DMT)-like permease